MAENDISIGKKKTWFYPNISSEPTNGTVAYNCPDFFNVREGNVNYTNGTVSGVEFYAEENTTGAERQGTLTLTVETAPLPEEYSGTATIICGWTITQAG